MSKKVERIALTEEFVRCPACGYNGGFHTTFKRLPDMIKMNLVCPSCHDEFDLNITVTITEKGGGG